MASKVSFTYVAPLFRFRSVDALVRLPSGLLIRELTDQERSDLYDPVQQLWEGASLIGSEGGFGLCWVEQARRGAEDAGTSADERLAAVEERFRAAVTALRLLAPGNVGIGLVAIWIGGRGLQRVHFVDAFAAGWCPYGLEAEDVPTLKQLVEALELSLSQQKGLRRAVQRFNASYRRGDDQDRIVDHWIALEGLFLRGEMGELTFKGAVRIAHYLGQSPAERWGFYTDAKRSYRLRSKIVHGERVKEAEVEAVRPQTEEMLRMALRAVVLHPESLDVDKLDRRAVRGVPEPAMRRP